MRSYTSHEAYGFPWNLTKCFYEIVYFTICNNIKRARTMDCISPLCRRVQPVLLDPSVWTSFHPCAWRRLWFCRFHPFLVERNLGRRRLATVAKTKTYVRYKITWNKFNLKVITALFFWKKLICHLSFVNGNRNYGHLY